MKFKNSTLKVYYDTSDKDLTGGAMSLFTFPCIYWYITYNCFSQLSYLSLSYWAFYPIIFLLISRKRLNYLKCSIKSIDLVVNKEFDKNVIRSEECDQCIEIFSGNHSIKKFDLESDYSQFHKVPISESEINLFNEMNVIFSFNEINSSNTYQSFKLKDLNFYIGKYNENKPFIIVENTSKIDKKGHNQTFLMNGEVKNSRNKYYTKEIKENEKNSSQNDIKGEIKRNKI